MYALALHTSKMYIFKKKHPLFRIINSKIFDLIVYSFTFAK